MPLTNNWTSPDDMWRCCIEGCCWEGKYSETIQADDLGTSCPICKKEAFPRDDGGWDKPKVNSHSDGMEDWED